jgi:sortase (surface protein transpeptidase)
VWHWTGTGYMGQQAHVGLFAHRTEAGSPLYHQHELGVGDDIYVTVSDRPGDRRQFHYRVVRSDLTGAGSNEILDATRYHPGTTISLIACTKLNRLPTDLKYRLITTAVLVGVLEDGFPVPMP